jgi:small subunit ribosomal protein S8
LADSLSKINNAVKALNKTVTLRKSKFLLSVLDVLKENGYVGNYEIVVDGRGDEVIVTLLGTINECKVIKPRFPVKLEEMESFEKRFLPAKDFGVLIISTNKGLLTQKSAKDNHVGGNLVAYCY